jgi:hypothetical protein
MAATVRILKGDMFEGPSDLIVLPCSTIPTVTPFVRDRLEEFDIPTPQGRMDLGEVRFVELQDAQQLAGLAAFAASVESVHVDGGTAVETLGAEIGAIEAIGKRLGAYARRNETARSIACPLLGTGAGALDVEDAARALTGGFLATAPDQAILHLYALTEDHYQTLCGFFQTGPQASDYVVEKESEATFVPPRVFISYTGTSLGHEEWVKGLAQWLRANGVNARLDQWHLRHGMDVAQWMCNELDLADRVLLICDERYAQKADRRHGGVGWEIRIVQGDLLGRADDATTTRYLPIIRTANVNDGTPAFLKSVFCFHWPPDRPEDRVKLLEAIFEVEEAAPEVALPPLYIREALAKRQRS